MRDMHKINQLGTISAKFSCTFVVGNVVVVLPVVLTGFVLEEL